MPNFFIAGSAKSGTTSLWQYLIQHPDIFMPEKIKEPAFFCPIYGMNDWDQYLALYSPWWQCKARGEASHSYMTSSESAKLICQAVPDAKFIFILRNPTDRAFSLYTWMVSHGYEWIYPFEKALMAESKRMRDSSFKYHNPEYYYNYLYFSSGLYAEQLRRYMDIFNRSQIHIVLTDDLKKTPLLMVQRIYRFLGVDADFTPSLDLHNFANASPRSIKAQFFIRKQIVPLFRRFRAEKLGRYLLNLNISFGEKESLHSATRTMLVERYRDNIIETSRLIEMDLSCWLSKSK